MGWGFYTIFVFGGFFGSINDRAKKVLLWIIVTPSPAS